MVYRRLILVAISDLLGSSTRRMLQIVIRAVLRHFPVGTAVLGLAGYWYLYSHQLVDRPIRADGVSYYQYLPAWIADGDPTFETQARDCCFGYTTELPIGIERRPETGRWLDVHPIGVALLMLPFFLAAHGLSWWSNLPRDGFSLYYQYIVGLAGLAYVVAGLTVLRRLLLRHFSEPVVLATLVSITFGTNLFHYAVYDSTYSHAFSFFLVALLLLLVELWWEAATVWRSVALAIVAALIILVRHTNVVFLAFVPLYGVSRWSDFRTNLNRLQQRRGLILVMLAVGLLCLSPQVLLVQVGDRSLDRQRVRRRSIVHVRLASHPRHTVQRSAGTVLLVAGSPLLDRRPGCRRGLGPPVGDGYRRRARRPDVCPCELVHVGPRLGLRAPGVY